VRFVTVVSLRCAHSRFPVMENQFNQCYPPGGDVLS
jgi:hypothetical protein